MSAPAGVTVVVPVWDRYCSFLPDCVEAVLGQAGERPALVVVDNASRRPLPTLPREIEIVRSERRLTVGAARNLGLSRVTTSEVIFCDADDRLLPDAATRLRSKLAARHDLVAVIGRYVSWNPATGAQAVLDRSPRPVAFRVARYPRVFALANLRYNCFPVVGGILRTNAVREAGGFGDANVGEDWILGAQLAFRGPIEFLRSPTFLRRVHEGSLWYRPHAPGVYLARTDQLRERVGHDPRVPGWVKAALPLLALVHRRDVARATAAGGAIEPLNPLLRPQGASE